MTLRGQLISSKRFRQIKEPLRSGIRNLGYEISRAISTKDDLVTRLLTSEGIATVLDVGANQGQYVGKLRHLGWRGPVVSFEPGSEAYTLLRQVSNNDPSWTTRQVALGSAPGEASLHLSRNSVSSSLLAVSDAHVAAEAEAAQIRTETVPVRQLDEELASLQANGPYWLKIDVQGFEQEVLVGAQKTLADARVVECELSLRAMYQDGANWRTVLGHLSEKGFTVIWLEPAFVDPSTGEMLQADAILARR